jgi:hypothetical protein
MRQSIVQRVEQKPKIDPITNAEFALNEERARGAFPSMQKAEQKIEPESKPAEKPASDSAVEKITTPDGKTIEIKALEVPEELQKIRSADSARWMYRPETTYREVLRVEEGTGEVMREGIRQWADKFAEMGASVADVKELIDGVKP